MEEHRFVLPSNVYPLLSPSDTTRPRMPLTSSTGNAQYHSVALANDYSDQKGLQPRPPPNFILPTLPSQPARPLHRTSLEAHKSHIRSQRISRGYKKNPFAESELYQAYRSRQPKKGDKKDQIWPDNIEDLFLEALCQLPIMGRRKFSIDGTSRGRNELIAIYMWLGYKDSLRPGQQPDESQRRDRKQVSSHIQVLKPYVKGHPAYRRLFPLKPLKGAPKNGLNDSFKNDPCLRALAEGHLPYRHTNDGGLGSSMTYELPSILSTRNYSTNLVLNAQASSATPEHHSITPALFKMYMTTLKPGIDFKDVSEDDAGNGKFWTKVHTYSDSIPRQIGSSRLEELPDWRTRFPFLAQAQMQNELNCDIIQVEVSLDLRHGSLPERAELWGRLHLLVPGDQEAMWRCTQSLHKPADLYGPSSADRQFENVTSTPTVDSYEPNVGTYLRVSFPAQSWAYTLQRLSTLEAQFEEARQSGTSAPTPTTARQYIAQISMIQELLCSVAPSQPFIRKAILLWNFRKCKYGEQGFATWRYLESSPPRSSCFSPHPGSAHFVSAVMSETFSAWAHDSEPPSLHLYPSVGSNPFDPLPSCNVLPTQSLQSITDDPNMRFPFPMYGYLPAPVENLNFTSQDTQESDSTLVDLHGGIAGSETVPMDTFLSAVGVLASFDQSSNLWEASTGVQDFEHDPAFLVGYGVMPSNEGAHSWNAAVDDKIEIWEVGDAAKEENWDVQDAALLTFEDLGHADK